MTTDLLTTRQVLDYLKVDRITIYRMLTDGRLKGVKIGQHWRFAREDVEALVSIRKPEPVVEQAPSNSEPIFPTHCVQTIQDLYSDIGQVSALVVDAKGELVTKASRHTAFCQLVLATPEGARACARCRQSAAANIDKIRNFTCPSGMQYIAAPIRVGDAVAGLFLSGSFYWRIPDPVEEAERLRRLAAAYNIPLNLLIQAADEIPVLQPDQQTRVEAWTNSAARAIESILHERTSFMERLKQIADLTQISR